MKDEIKEILEFDFESQGERIEINEYERNILKDYLTNLQEELQEANESITWWTNRFKAVEKENERLKEINKINNDEDYIYTYEELQDKVLKLQKEYNDLSKKLWSEVDDRIEYKSRCEKAIEKLKYYKAKPYNEYDVDDVIIDLDYILNGDNEE